MVVMVEILRCSPLSVEIVAVKLYGRFLSHNNNSNHYSEFLQIKRTSDLIKRLLSALLFYILSLRVCLFC